MKHLKTFENSFYNYNIDDYVKVKIEEYDKLKDEIDVWFEDVKISDRYNHENKNFYYGMNSLDKEIFFIEYDIKRKLTKSEIEEYLMKKNISKYNI